MENRLNKYMRVAYTLNSVQNGVEEEVEKTSREQPYKFITGIGYSLEFFEDKLYDLAKGDKFDFVVPCDEAFGEYNPQHRQKLDRTIFEVDGEIDEKHVFVGNVLQMINADGSPVLGTVISIGPDAVEMDFNHPLAGCDLHFAGEMIESRPATEEEIKEVLNTQHGCGCGSCSGDCEEGCGGEHHHDGCGCGHCH